MIEKTFIILNDFVNLFLCFTYYLAVKLKFQKNVPRNFKYIEYYLYLTLIFCCINELCFYKIINIKGLYFIIPFALIHQFLLIKYIISESEKLREVRLDKLIFIIMIIVQFLTCIVDFIFKSFYSASVANVSIIFHCVLLFNIIFKNELVNSLKNNFEFYTIIGIFLSTCLMTPIILFGKYFFNSINKDSYYLVASIAPISSLLFYLFILKGITCFGRIRI